MPGAIDIEPNAFAYSRTRNIKVRGCVFDAVDGDAGCVGFFQVTAQASLTQPARNIVIENCTFKNCTNTTGPIYLLQSQTPTVTTERNEIQVVGNMMYDNAGSPLQAEGTRGLRIERNYFASHS
jgi:hypothetical protein